MTRAKLVADSLRELFAVPFRETMFVRLDQLQNAVASPLGRRDVAGAMHAQLFMTGIVASDDPGMARAPGGGEYSRRDFGLRLEVVRVRLARFDDLQ